MKFLVFQHVPHEPPGLIADFTKEEGITLDVIKLWKKYKIPNVLNYDALIIMGGPMGVYDNKKVYPSKQDELKAIKKALGKVPMIGFCLGSQILAHVLGANVHPNIRNSKKIKEIGYYDIKLTKDGKTDTLFKGFSSQIDVLQLHGDVFDLPKGATLLASSRVCKNQAFRYKNVYGVLFHFEITPSLLKRIIKVDNKWIHDQHDIDEKEFMKESIVKEKLMKEQSKQLLSNFLSAVM